MADKDLECSGSPIQPYHQSRIRSSNLQLKLGYHHICLVYIAADKNGVFI